VTGRFVSRCDESHTLTGSGNWTGDWTLRQQLRRIAYTDWNPATGPDQQLDPIVSRCDGSHTLTGIRRLDW